jgi:hypothetical protein
VVPTWDKHAVVEDVNGANAPVARPRRQVPTVGTEVVRALGRFEPGRPAYARGIRAAVAIGGLVAVVTAIDDIGTAILWGIGALNCVVTDSRDDAVNRRGKALGVIAVVSSFGLTLGALAGAHLWSSLPVLAAVAFVGGMASLFGSWVAGTGLTFVIMFILGTGVAGGHAPGEVFLQALGGGVVAVVVLTLDLPANALGPARRATGRALASVAGLYDALATGARPSDLMGSANVARHGLEEATSVITASRSRRPTRRSELAWLTDRVSAGADLLDVGEALVALELRGDAPDLATAADPIARRAMAATAQSLRAMVGALVGGPRVGSGPAFAPMATGSEDGVVRAVKELDQVIVELRHRASADAVAAIEAVLPYRTLLDDGVRALRTLVGEVDAGTAKTIEAHRQITPLADMRDAVTSIARNLTPKSSTFRRSAQFAVTAVIGMVVGQQLHLDHPYWVTLTIAVILGPAAAPSLQRAAVRVGGTLVGSILAAVILASVHSQDGLIAAIILLAGATFSVIQLNYGLGVVFITPLVLVLVSAPHPGQGDWHLLVSRLVESVVGAGLAVVSGLVLWPGAASLRIAHKLSAALSAEGSFVAAAVELRTDPSATSDDRIAEARSAAELEIDNVQADIDRWLGDVPRQREVLGLLWGLLDDARRVYVELSAVAELAAAHVQQESVDEATPRIVSPTFVPVLSAIGAVAADIDEKLHELGTSLTAGRPPPAATGGTTTAAIAVLAREMEEHRLQRQKELERGQFGPTPSAADWQDYEAVESSLLSIVGLTEDMAMAVGALAAV